MLGTRVLMPLALLLSSCATLAQPQSGTGELRRNLAVVGGERWIEENEFDRLDSPVIVGAEFDIYRQGRWFGWEAGLYHHRETMTLPVTMRTRLRGTELAVGLRRTFELEGWPLLPYGPAQE